MRSFHNLSYDICDSKYSKNLAERTSERQESGNTSLVDADMEGNCVEDEVEQLIQVALFFTLSSPMERPKISEVVRMLEGDGLVESVKVSSKQLPSGELRRRLTLPIPFFNRAIGANVWLPRDLLGIYRLLAEAIVVAMDRVVSAISSSAFLCLFLVFSWLFQASGNAEGDALIALKTNLADPNNVLQNWNSTLVNPCTWFNVTCNSENSVTRVGVIDDEFCFHLCTPSDLGNANLSGQLVPQLGLLLNLQYLELYSNNISGRIPIELGNLTSLVSLDLYLNNLSGIIPDTLGRLQKLRFLFLITRFSRKWVAYALIYGNTDTVALF
ncbi:hypothetical protein TEA_011497 [Camellia sinensis var. sinensis]|uniref:Leucine-rich repeat-containing N-terminal plant-type domain-containing protein n=1 Tax=Camellia sinensis var. sinensis TaxID=542762 RepID=A0A4S4EW14_CAMSN|nr:hypothetical protein TEA_011497 [Camellia sinensis var. sinensis]